MRQHPYRAAETGRQALPAANGCECTGTGEKLFETPTTLFEREVLDQLKNIIALLKESQRVKSIKDILK